MRAREFFQHGTLEQLLASAILRAHIGMYGFYIWFHNFSTSVAKLESAEDFVKIHLNAVSARFQRKSASLRTRSYIYLHGSPAKANLLFSDARLNSGLLHDPLIVLFVERQNARNIKFFRTL